MEEADLVLLEQVQDAVVVLLHDGVLAADHLRHVDLHVGGRDAVLGEMLVGMLEMFRGLQQRLEGMQPTFVQVPPGAGPPFSFFHSSMQATLKPAWAARMAAM